MNNIPHKSVTVEQKTDSSLQINLDFSDPLEEEEEEEDLVVEITDPKEIEKLQLPKDDFLNFLKKRMHITISLNNNF